MSIKLPPFLKFLIVFLAMLPVALFAYLGQFSRLMSDDYCTIAVGQELGAWEGMLYWFNSWAGSYSNFFFKSVIASIDINAPIITPLIIIVVWFMGLFWLTSQILSRLQVDAHRFSISIVIANAIIFTTLNALYSPQSFYWFAASTPYTLPLAVFTIFLALSVTIIHTSLSNTILFVGLLVGGAICFISAGASEIFVAFQSALMTLLLGLIFIFSSQLYRNRYLLVFGSGWIATLISLLIQLTSPGVSNRLATEANNIERPLTSLSEIIPETINLTFQYLSHTEAFTGFVILFLVTLLVTLAFYTPEQTTPTNNNLSLPSRFITFWIIVQLIYIPILWGHSSDTPQLLGRFSYGYFVIILIHAIFLAGMIGVLLKREWVESQIQKYGWHYSYIAVGCLFLVLFMLTQWRSIHFKASNFLFINSILLLTGIAWQHQQAISTKRVDRVSYFVLACHISVLILIVSVTFTALLGRGLVTPRILSPVAYLLVLLGLLWGGYLGFLLKQNLIVSRMLVSSKLPVIVVMASVIFLASGGILIGHASLISDLQAYSSDWDARHIQILAMRDSGQLNIEVSLLKFDLADMIQVTNLSQDPANRCAKRYYGVQSITVTNDE